MFASINSRPSRRSWVSLLPVAGGFQRRQSRDASGYRPYQRQHFRFDSNKLFRVQGARFYILHATATAESFTWEGYLAIWLSAQAVYHEGLLHKECYSFGSCSFFYFIFIQISVLEERLTGHRIFVLETNTSKKRHQGHYIH